MSLGLLRFTRIWTPSKIITNKHFCIITNSPVHRLTGSKSTKFRYSTLHVPKYFNFSSDVIDSWAEKEKTGKRDISNPAFWWIDDYGSEEKLNFQDLSSESKRVADLFTKLGLNKGDKVLVILPRLPEWWFINLACIRTGIIISPCTTLLRANDIQKRLISSKAKCIIADKPSSITVDQVSDDFPELKHKLLISSSETSTDGRKGWLNFKRLLNDCDETFENIKTLSDESMMLFFTSGTTGFPKMVEHTHASYGIGHKLTADYFLRVTEKDVVWNMSDTGWAKCAWSSLFAPWNNGACVFVHHTAKFDPKVMLHNLCQYPITHLCTAPTAYRSVVKLPLNQYKFQALKYSFGAGEPVNPELKTEWFDGTGLDLYEGYGQTETTLLCGTNYPELESRDGSMGKPPPGIDLQIVDDEGQLLDPGIEGNIAVRCKPNKPVGLFTSYLNDKKRTDSVLKGDFYLTGDRGEMDKDGYFYFIGRADDVILSAGYRIGPFEVESALLEHRAVLESAVVSSPDKERGEIVKAFIILTDEYKQGNPRDLITELQNHVKLTTAPYKYPRKIEFVETLPKTVSGKIRRIELRNNEWNHNRPAST